MSSPQTNQNSESTGDYSKKDKKLKLMTLGDINVGKTSIARRFVEGDFTSDYIQTVGIDFFEKTLEIDGQSVKVQIWDTAGQDR